MCKDCDRTFNNKTGTIFAHAKIGLDKLLFAFYMLLQFNTSIHQLDAELSVLYRSLRRRVEQFARTLDAPAIDLLDPVRIDEVYVTTGLKGRKSRSRGLSTRGRGRYADDKPSVITLIDRGSEQRYTVPAKSADASNVRLLFDNHEEESLTAYTDRFLAYDPLENDENFQREVVIHGDDEYDDGDAHVNTCKSHRRTIDAWLSLHRDVSKDKITPYLRDFQLRCRILRKSGRDALKKSFEPSPNSTTTCFT